MFTTLPSYAVAVPVVCLNAAGARLGLSHFFNTQLQLRFEHLCALGVLCVLCVAPDRYAGDDEEDGDVEGADDAAAEDFGALYVYVVFTRGGAGWGGVAGVVASRWAPTHAAGLAAGGDVLCCVVVLQPATTRGTPP